MQAADESADESHKQEIWSVMPSKDSEENIVSAQSHMQVPYNMFFEPSQTLIKGTWAVLGHDDQYVPEDMYLDDSLFKRWTLELDCFESSVQSCQSRKIQHCTGRQLHVVAY